MLAAAGQRPEFRAPDFGWRSRSVPIAYILMACLKPSTRRANTWPLSASTPSCWLCWIGVAILPLRQIQKDAVFDIVSGMAATNGKFRTATGFARTSGNLAQSSISPHSRLTWLCRSSLSPAPDRLPSGSRRLRTTAVSAFSAMLARFQEAGEVGAFAHLGMQKFGPPPARVSQIRSL